MKTRYEIHRDGHFFAGFTEGNASRFGEPFNDAVALREFDSCVEAWKVHGRGRVYAWEFRILKQA